jgi:endoglucanase
MIGDLLFDVLTFLVIPTILILIAAGIFYCRKKQKKYRRVIIPGALLLLIAFSFLLGQFLQTPSFRNKPVGVNKLHPAIAPQLHVAGNQLLDSKNRPVRLIGANRSGTEYKCFHGGIFDGPSDQKSIDAMLAWHINAIRIPLNEDCWLNVNMRGSKYSGDVYQNAIERYVILLIDNGITPILDLHWSAPGTQQAVGLQPMPDRDHSVEFWRQVAEIFRGNNAVIFDLFNEPYPDNDRKTTAAWNCWKYGTHPTYCPLGTAGLNYNAAGMQDLVTAVREVEASNIIMLGGIQYASTLDRWKDYLPMDPLNNLVASWHLYNSSYCSDFSCWFLEVLPVVKSYPVIAGEIGENDRDGAFITQVMNFLDAPAKNLKPQSYLAWVWNTDQTIYDLITDYASGNPTTPYGQVFKDHLSNLSAPDPANHKKLASASANCAKS